MWLLAFKVAAPSIVSPTLECTIRSLYWQANDIKDDTVAQSSLLLFSSPRDRPSDLDRDRLGSSRHRSLWGGDRSRSREYDLHLRSSPPRLSNPLSFPPSRLSLSTPLLTSQSSSPPLRHARSRPSPRGGGRSGGRGPSSRSFHGRSSLRASLPPHWRAPPPTPFAPVTGRCPGGRS